MGIEFELYLKETIETIESGLFNQNSVFSSSRYIITDCRLVTIDIHYYTIVIKIEHMSRNHKTI